MSKRAKQRLVYVHHRYDSIPNNIRLLSFRGMNSEHERTGVCMLFGNWKNTIRAPFPEVIYFKTYMRVLLRP